MPQSRHRHKHQHHHHVTTGSPHTARPTARKSAAPIMAVFVALIGVGISFLAGTGIVMLVIAGIAGAVIGYLIGSSMDKAASKK